MDAGEPVVLLGDSGTGKSHLLIGLGLAACEQGRRVRYITTAQLVNELVEAADERVLSRFAGRRLPIRLAARCLDELGYVQIDPRGAELLFQIITEREERASIAIAIATNLPFSEWGQRVPRPSARRRDRRPRHLQRPHPRDRDRVLPATHQQDCRSRQERSPAKLRRPPSPARPDLNPHGDELALQIPQNPHRLGVVETRRDRPLHA
jgi:chromosomal replication initiation ATPase DnaA